MLKKINPLIAFFIFIILAIILIILSEKFKNDGLYKWAKHIESTVSSKIKDSKNSTESQQIKVQSIENIINENGKNLYLLKTENGIFQLPQRENLKLSNNNIIFVRYPLPNEDGKLPEVAVKMGVAAICIEQNSDIQCFPGQKLANIKQKVN